MASKTEEEIKVTRDKAIKKLNELDHYYKEFIE